MSKKKASSNEIKPWYELIPKSLITEYHNPSYDNHLLKLPFFMLIVGATGSGKTTLCLEIIHRCQDTFGHITIICQNQHEPLYQFLKSKLKSEDLSLIEGYENIPEMEDLDKNLQHLIIFDDLVLTRNQDRISEYFIRARKIAKGCSCIYLTQSYFAVPKTIRLQCGYIILKKLSSTRDINMILKDFSLGKSREELLKIYKECTENKKDFLLIDIHTEEQNRYRHNFLKILQV